MFENLKAGDTIKIGEKEFKVSDANVIRDNVGIYQIAKQMCYETFYIEKKVLAFLGAEVVRKAPPRFTPVNIGLKTFALSTGKLDQFGHLIVFVDNYFEHWPVWEVLEIEKC
jgi:hypothetical protein